MAIISDVNNETGTYYRRVIIQSKIKSIKVKIGFRFHSPEMFGSKRKKLREEMYKKSSIVGHSYFKP